MEGERTLERETSEISTLWAEKGGQVGGEKSSLTSHFGLLGRVSGFVFTSEQTRGSCFRFSFPPAASFAAHRLLTGR